MTEAQCDNPTNETKKMVLNLSQTHFNPFFLAQVSKEAASMLEDILLLENVGPIILCLLAGPFSDRWDCLITSFDTLADLRRYSF